MAIIEANNFFWGGGVGGAVGGSESPTLIVAKSDFGKISKYRAQTSLQF